ncbi:MAG TPA: folate-binding protein [Burkholderiales bacterium]|nr:folate-binding protein [Burkholderiales bacterium]
MNAGWQDYLQRAGAIIENRVVCDFGNPQAELRAVQTGTVLCDLSQFGLLYFSGEDSRAYLNSQLSGDVQKLSAGTAQYSSYCTSKGRVLASLLIWQTAEGYFAQLHADLCEDIRNRLARFVLRSKVKINDASGTHVCLGVAGKNAESLANECFGSVPESTLEVAHDQSATLIRIASDRFQVICPAQQAPGLWERLSEYAIPTGSECWDWLNIRSGIAVITPAMQEQFVPQMLNMDIIGAVSFSKGCYPGQEIVARTQHLGTLKRRMYLGNILSEIPPEPGDELFSEIVQVQASGMIVNAAASPDGGYDVLAVIQIDAARGSVLRWQSPGGPVLRLLPLPYSV